MYVFSYFTPKSGLNVTKFPKIMTKSEVNPQKSWLNMTKIIKNMTTWNYMFSRKNLNLDTITLKKIWNYLHLIWKYHENQKIHDLIKKNLTPNNLLFRHLWSNNESASDQTDVLWV